MVALVLCGACGCAPTLRFRYKPLLTKPGADLVAALVVASGNESVDGNAVAILENGNRAFPAMLAAIRGARSSVHIETFIFRDGTIGREFVSALAERARAGVKVRLLLDAFGSGRFGEANVETLERAGADVVFFRPLRLRFLSKINLRTHRKVLIVDGRIAFTGGICIDDAWLGDADRPDRWRETQIRVEGPVVRQMQAAFARAWIEATGELLSARSLYPAIPLVGEIACQLMDSTPGVAVNPARLSFLVAVGAARSSIEVTNAYFVPDHVTRDALVKAAERGVRVRLVLPSRNTDSRAVRYAGRIYYRRLLEAGVEIYEYEPARLHAKTMVVDGEWASVGSTNLDRRSFAYNYESNLNVFDRGFARRMHEMFERDLSRCSRVTLDEWKTRPFSEKLLERFYGIFRNHY